MAELTGRTQEDRAKELARMKTAHTTMPGSVKPTGFDDDESVRVPGWIAHGGAMDPSDRTYSKHMEKKRRERAHEIEAADDAEVAAFRQQATVTASASLDLFAVPPPPPKAKKEGEPAPIRMIKKKRRKDAGDKTSTSTAAPSAGDAPREARVPPETGS
jgi:hypothetical protein